MFARIVVPGIEMFPGSCSLKGTKKSIHYPGGYLPYFSKHMTFVKTLSPHALSTVLYYSLSNAT